MTSPTVTVIVSESPSGKVPSSVTSTSKAYTPGPWASVGVQVNTPVVGSMLAPAGAPARLNVNALAGASESLAVAVKVNWLPSFTDWSPMRASTGAALISPTVIVIVSKASRAGLPSSVTRTVTS